MQDLRMNWEDAAMIDPRRSDCVPGLQTVLIPGGFVNVLFGSDGLSIGPGSKTLVKGRRQQRQDRHRVSIPVSIPVTIPPVSTPVSTRYATKDKIATRTAPGLVTATDRWLLVSCVLTIGLPKVVFHYFMKLFIRQITGRKQDGLCTVDISYVACSFFSPLCLKVNVICAIKSPPSVCAVLAWGPRQSTSAARGPTATAPF